jgi:threonine dehydratase
LDWLAKRILDEHHRICSSVRCNPVEDISELVCDGKARVYVKLENQQETGSFKLRGATNRMHRLSPDERAQGVVAASNGNHGLGVAAAAWRAGIQAEVYVSAQVSAKKAKRIEQLGARIVRAGDDPLEAETIVFPIASIGFSARPGLDPGTFRLTA